MSQGGLRDRRSIHRDLERVRADLHGLVAHASAADLRRGTDGTRWTNQQMLFHMVFGYMIVRRLLWLVRAFGRLPDTYGQGFARLLNSATRPFHVVNYLGSCGGAVVFRGRRLTRQLDRTMDALHRSLDAATEDELGHRMHFPVDWDPFFRATMTLEDVYRYGTQHYDFHREQLTLADS
ncbi:DinB family protein [Cellulomonas sp. P5_C6]